MWIKLHDLVIPNVSHLHHHSIITVTVTLNMKHVIFNQRLTLEVVQSTTRLLTSVFESWHYSLLDVDMGTVVIHHHGSVETLIYNLISQWVQKVAMKIWARVPDSRGFFSTSDTCTLRLIRRCSGGMHVADRSGFAGWCRNHRDTQNHLATEVFVTYAGGLPWFGSDTFSLAWIVTSQACCTYVVYSWIVNTQHCS